MESAISHVHSGDPSPGAPQASAPAPPAVRPGLSRGAHGPHPTRAHEAPRKLLPVAAGQQGCWACGQALGKQEPLTHGHIGHREALPQETTLITLHCWAAGFAVGNPPNVPAGQSGRPALFLDGRTARAGLAAGWRGAPGTGACSWAALAPPPGGSQWPHVPRQAAGPRLGPGTTQGRAGRVGRAQAADCIAVKMGPWRKDHPQPVGLCALPEGPPGWPQGS